MASSAAPAGGISWGSDLNATDFQNLEDRWITRDIAEKMGLRRLANEEGREMFGWSRPRPGELGERG